MKVMICRRGHPKPGKDCMTCAREGEQRRKMGIFVAPGKESVRILTYQEIMNHFGELATTRPDEPKTLVMGRPRGTVRAR